MAERMEKRRRVVDAGLWDWAERRGAKLGDRVMAPRQTGPVAHSENGHSSEYHSWEGLTFRARGDIPVGSSIMRLPKSVTVTLPEPLAGSTRGCAVAEFFHELVLPPNTKGDVCVICSIEMISARRDTSSDDDEDDEDDYIPHDCESDEFDWDDVDSEGGAGPDLRWVRLTAYMLTRCYARYGSSHAKNSETPRISPKSSRPEVKHMPLADSSGEVGSDEWGWVQHLPPLKELPQPHLWTEAELTLLSGTSVHFDILSDRASMRLESEIAWPAVAASMEAGALPGLTADTNSSQPSQQIIEAYCRMSCIVAQFALPGAYGEPVLVPVLGMMPRRINGNCIYEVGQDGNYEVVATETILDGDMITLQPDVELELHSSLLLRRFGYWAGNHLPGDAVVFTLEELASGRSTTRLFARVKKFLHDRGFINDDEDGSVRVDATIATALIDCVPDAPNTEVNRLPRILVVVAVLAMEEGDFDAFENANPYADEEMDDDEDVGEYADTLLSPESPEPAPRPAVLVGPSTPAEDGRAVASDDDGECPQLVYVSYTPPVLPESAIKHGMRLIGSALMQRISVLESSLPAVDGAATVQREVSIGVRAAESTLCSELLQIIAKINF